MREVILENIKSSNPNTFLTYKMLECVPYIFQSDFDSYISWKSTLSYRLKVDSKAITIVGSASLGISLNPNKNFKQFDEKSDIDVAIISHYYFDESWYFLRNLGSSYHSYSPIIKEAINDHISRLIYWGTIATDKLLPILPFAKEWTSTIEHMKKIEPTKDRRINFRIYKDYESLRAYQLLNLKSLQSKLLEENYV